MPAYDRISDLPESLIIQILSYLRTKDSVKTSVLSSRWKNLCLSVPVLDFSYKDCFINHNDMIISFIDRFLDFKPELRLREFKVICCVVGGRGGFTDRICKAIDKGVQHLDVKSNMYYVEDDTHIYPCIEFVPLNLYTSKTLVSLKLSFSGIEDPGLVSLPCLRFMELVEIKSHDTANLEKLILGCPVLEELVLVKDMNDELAVTRFRSQSMKRFSVPSRYVHSSSVESTLEIDAPGLEYMSLGDDQFDRIVVKNLSSLLTVDLHIKFLVGASVSVFSWDLSKRKEIRDFLNGIYGVRHMIISSQTVKALYLYSKVELIPKFNNLSRLQAVFPRSLLQFFPAFLESCPNLKHLILKVVVDGEASLDIKTVPKCFLSTLECVEMKGMFEREEDEMKIASYFLENAALLKKLVVSRGVYPSFLSDSEVYEELNKITKRSPTCQIVLDFELC
ncbi:unnamed protein product [Cochlearia groenlandica]